MGKKSICSVPGCPGVHEARGYCNRHYIQIRRHGKILEDGPTESLPGEVWKDIDEINGKRQKTIRYQISNFGRAKSLFFGRERILKPQINKKERTVRVSLGVGVCCRVDRLVLKYFVENPYGESRTYYVDGDWKNCMASNLSYKGIVRRKKTLASLKLQASGDRDAKDIVKYNKGMAELIEKSFSNFTK